MTCRDGADGEGRPGVVKDGIVFDVDHPGEAVGEPYTSTMPDLTDPGPDAQAAIVRALASTDGARPAGIAVHEDTVRLLAPDPPPAQEHLRHRSELCRARGRKCQIARYLQGPAHETLPLPGLPGDREKVCTNPGRAPESLRQQTGRQAQFDESS